jgi:hypothetical protein
VRRRNAAARLRELAIDKSAIFNGSPIELTRIA